MEKAPRFPVLLFLQWQNQDNHSTYPRGLSGRGNELVQVSHLEHSLFPSRYDTWYLSKPFHNDDLIRVSPSSNKGVEADAITFIQQVREEIFRKGYWRWGLEPLEPSLVKLTQWPRQSLFWELGIGWQGSCFDGDRGSILPPRLVLHSKRPRSAADTLTRLPSSWFPLTTKVKLISRLAFTDTKVRCHLNALQPNDSQ